MVYNFFKKVGITLTIATFIIMVTAFIIFISHIFVSSISNWIMTIRFREENRVIYIVIVSFFLLFTLGIVLFIFGEIIDFLFGNYRSLLLEKKEYTLSEEEKNKTIVIIPAFNEEETIKTAIEQVKPYCKHVLVVDDGSTDNTKRIAEECNAIVLSHKVNLGLGQSLRDGIKKALSLNAQAFVIFDADLQYQASDIPKLLYYIFREDYDLVMGSRLAGKIEKMNFLKKFGNIMYTKLLRYLTREGITDGQTGLRAFTQEFAKSIKIRGDFTYTQEMILEAVSKKFKIGEIPIYFARRISGHSRLMRNPFHFAKSSGIFLLKVLIDLNPLKIYALISGFLITVGFYMGGKEVVDWLLYSKENNISDPIWAIIGIVIIMNAFVILFIGLIFSASKNE